MTNKQKSKTSTFIWAPPFGACIPRMCETWPASPGKSQASLCHLHLNYHTICLPYMNSYFCRSCLHSFVPCKNGRKKCKIFRLHIKGHENCQIPWKWHKKCSDLTNTWARCNGASWTLPQGAVSRGANPTRWQNLQFSKFDRKILKLAGRFLENVSNA